MKKNLSRLLSCLAIALTFTACGDNAIEAETEMMDESFAARDQSIDKLNKQMDRTDFYACKEKYGSTRCNSFYAKFGTFESKEIADTLNYDNHANYIGPDKEHPEYLTENWQLVMTLVSFTQMLDSIQADNHESEEPAESEDGEPKDSTVQNDESGDVEVEEDGEDAPEENAEEGEKESDEEGEEGSDEDNDDSYLEFLFTVTVYSEGEEIFSREFTALQDTSGEAQWKGEETARMIIPRGTDEIQICIGSSKIDDVGDEVFSGSDCINLEKIGQLDSTTYEQMVSEWEGLNAVWGWALSSID